MLSTRQVSCVCNAVRQRFASVIVERAPLPTVLSPQVSASALSATLPFTDVPLPAPLDTGAEILSNELVNGGGGEHLETKEKLNVRESSLSPPPLGPGIMATSRAHAAVRYPNCDPCTGGRSTGSSPSWSKELSAEQCALRKTQLVIFLLKNLKIGETYWPDYLITCEDTADDVLNAYCFQRTCPYRSSARHAWYGVLEREFGPSKSQSRSAFRKWWINARTANWMEPELRSPCEQDWSQFLVDKYQRLYCASGPAEHSTSTSTLDDIVAATEGAELVSGGGGRTHGKRKVKESLPSPPLSPIESEGAAHSWAPPAVFWPVWALPTDEAISVIHVTVGHAAPVDVEVPAVWTRNEIERAFASHVAAKLEWVDFTWVEFDVCVEYSAQFPLVDSPDGEALRAQYFDMPSIHGHRRAVTNSHETIIGHRATHGRGLTSYTHAHWDAVRALVSAIIAFVPSAIFNAAAIVKHASAQVHRDRSNDPHSDMIILPQDVPADSWVWVESSTGSSAVQMYDQPIFGAWYPYDRILCFSSALAHRVQAPSLSLRTKNSLINLRSSLN
eukprot:418042-Amphidinium_carterae.1